MRNYNPNKYKNLGKGLKAVSGASYISRRVEFVQDGTLIPIRKELKGSGRMPRRRNLYFGTMTDGELKIALLREQLEILKAFYTDPTGSIQKGLDLVNYEINNGLHTRVGAGRFFSSIPEELNTVAKAIQVASRSIRPATGKMLRIKNIDSPSIAMAFDPFDYDTSIAPNLDCGTPPQPAIFDTTSQYNAALREYEECIQIQKDIDTLNQYLGDSAHHFMYDFLTTSQATSEGGLVSVKWFEHKAVINVLDETLFVSRDNLQLWSNNGVMRHNVKQGSPVPYSAIDSIRILKGEAQKAAGVNEPITAIIAAVGTAIAGIIAAVSAAVAKSKEMSRQLEIEDKLADVAKNFGTKDGSPSKDDFTTDNTEGLSESGGFSLTTLAFGGSILGGLYLLTNNNK